MRAWPGTSFRSTPGGQRTRSPRRPANVKTVACHRRPVSRALLTHGKLGPVSSKTANAILRFAPGTVTCIVDAEAADAGASVTDRLGHGPEVPIVADAEAALDLGADELVIGVAPIGGKLPKAWRADIRVFLEAGATVTSGLHTFLGDDPELSRLADDHGATIDDLRRPPERRRIADGSGADHPGTVVYVSGTDCSSGKMTTTMLLRDLARDRGIDAGVVATGQTGLMLDPDAGAPMDAVVSDFLAGEMEACVLECDRDLVLVEGQGALGHPGYGQVTMGMLLGAWPDAVVMCHVPGRRWREGFPEGTYAMPSLADEADLTERVLGRTSGADVVAASLNTHALDDAEARSAIEEVAARTGLVAGDPVRFGADAILDAIVEVA